MNVAAQGTSEFARLSLEGAPITSFHRRLILYSCGGPICDGYILGIIAIALPYLSKDLALNASAEGIIAAAMLGGMFVGGALFGYVTDLFGRKVMYTLDLLVLLGGSLAQLWVETFWVLLALRFLLGVAVGADYPIVTAMIAEFVPQRARGPMLAVLVLGFWVGYTTSFVAAYFIAGSGEDAWRWMLASSALPAALAFLLRQGTPESPRWLRSKGRETEADSVLKQYIGQQYYVAEEAPVATDWRLLLRSPYRTRLVFVCLFWMFQIIPMFGIFTFSPRLLDAMGIADPNLGAALISLLFLVGVLPAIALVNRLGRAPLLKYPFLVTATALFLIGLFPHAPIGVMMFLFILFVVFNTGSSVLQWVYPSELFPTGIRATAVGVATSVSRIGAAVGTFLLPVGLERFGLGPCMLAYGTVCAAGYLLSLAWAPETKDLTLAEASGVAPNDY